MYIFVDLGIQKKKKKKKEGGMGGGGGVEHRKEENYASMGHSHIFAN